MFSNLSEKFEDTFRKLSGRGRISESNVREAMGEVRTALLEADVHYEVVEQFCERSRRKGHRRRGAHVPQARPADDQDRL